MKSKNYTYQLTVFIFLSFLFSTEIKLGHVFADRIFNELDEVRQVSIEMEKEQRKINAHVRKVRNFNKENLKMSAI